MPAGGGGVNSKHACRRGRGQQQTCLQEGEGSTANMPAGGGGVNSKHACRRGRGLTQTCLQEGEGSHTNMPAGGGGDNSKHAHTVKKDTVSCSVGR